MKRKASMGIALLLSLVLLISMTACNTNPISTTQQTTTTSSGTTTEATTAQTTEPTIKTGGTIKIGTGLSPAILGYTPEAAGNLFIPYLRLTFNTLLFYDETGKMIPQLAESWETNPDAATITFHLRTGVKFSDGTDFNAAAVKWNIEQYQTAKRSEVAVIKSIDTPDDKTVVLNLTSWNSSTLEAVGFFVYYMSPAAFEANGGIEGTRMKPVGTGPFVLTEFVQTVSAKYSKNPNYWEEGKPYLDGVDISIIAEPTTLLSSFQAGELDLITASVDMLTQINNIDEYVLNSNKSGVGLESVGIVPSSKDPGDPFYKAEVRQAMCYALNKEEIVGALGRGYLKTMNQWAVDGASTYNPDVQGYPYDPEKAKKLLADAGFANGFDTKIYTVSALQNWATAIADQLTAVGIRTTVELVDGTQNYTFMTSGWSNGIVFHFASISPDLGLYMGRHLDANGAFFAAGIQHPQDALDLLAKIRTAKDATSKQKFSWELQKLIYDKYALFGQPLYVNTSYSLKYKYVMDDNWSVNHAICWIPQNCWLDK